MSHTPAGALLGWPKPDTVMPSGRTHAEVLERVRVWRATRDNAGVLPPHPAPEVPCRLATAEDMGRAALALQRAAQRAGARVQVTYARGRGVHGTTGRPTSVKDSIAVRCWMPDGGRLVACYSRAGKTWTFEMGLAWSKTMPLRHVGATEVCDMVATLTQPIGED